MGAEPAVVASLAISLARPGAAADGVAPVLRGRALEIVDDRGRVRASITVFPADPAVKMPDGHPTNICFGGKDGRTAYVTEAKMMRLVQFRVDRPGLEWTRWQR